MLVSEVIEIVSAMLALGTSSNLLLWLNWRGLGYGASVGSFLMFFGLDIDNEPANFDPINLPFLHP